MKTAALLILLAIGSLACQNESVSTGSTGSPTSFQIKVTTASPLLSSEYLGLNIRNENIFKSVTGVTGDSVLLIEDNSLKVTDTLRLFVGYYDRSSLNCGPINTEITLGGIIVKRMTLTLGAPQANCTDGTFYSEKFTVR